MEVIEMKALLTYRGEKSSSFKKHFGPVWICAIIDSLPRNIQGEYQVGGK